jgi:glutathione synthase
MSSRLRIGFLMDPLEQVVVGHDTTFVLMLAARARGHEVRVLEQHQLAFRHDRTWARMRTVELRNKKGEHFHVLRDELAPLSDLDVLFLRKDPPVDAAFVHATQLVELAGPGEKGPLLVNRAASLRDANEKLFGLRFPELMPRSVVSADAGVLRAFLREEARGQAVLKPLDGFGGKGILLLRQDDRNLSALIELATEGGRCAVMAQAYLPAATEGDKRILLLDGEPLGAVLRVPAQGEARANMAVGGRPVRTALTERERHICATLKPELQARGLAFVGIDVIGEHLTEVNVTSPTGAAEVDALDGADVGGRVVAWVEGRAEGRALPPVVSARAAGPTLAGEGAGEGGGGAGGAPGAGGGGSRGTSGTGGGT